MVNSLSDSIYNMSDTVWQGGANITKYLKGGNFLTAKTSLAETNAAGADRDGPSLQATEFFENQFVSALINSYFKSNNAYIVYVSSKNRVHPQKKLAHLDERFRMAGSSNSIARTRGGISHRRHARRIGLVKDAMTSLRVGMKPWWHHACPMVWPSYISKCSKRTLFNPRSHPPYSAFSGAQANSQPQSFYIRDFSVNDITYDPVYMIESSVNGFLANGFK